MEQSEDQVAENKRRVMRGVWKQFKETKCHHIDMLKDEMSQLPFILKSKRIEYLFEAIRQQRDKIER